MDGAVCERLGESVVDEPVLVDEREPREARADHCDMEVVAASCAVDNLDALGVRERAFEQ